ncbi:HPF/RaiA family ribosome-associated protein [Nitrosovibrio tenuis]|uniref:Ribosomal subunit interface protein n=1 Tax=Nitrosovibrio tenuis TaxID=1233 RepID=A0A1H7KG65_9PROT|nr:HPF/RaiA family ribosome-associated protein [Nitrosovibrio tenuis]SEK85520.1 ribosomal subunit interface protein [Nitrosovibrio tenuis]
MNFIFQITARDVPHSEALESHVRQKAEKLAAFYPHIMSCRVVIEVPHKHKHQGRAFNVRLDITVPGKEMAVNREADEDVYVALRDTFDAAKRQLEDYGRRQRGNIKAHAPVLHGRVKRLVPGEGYGFIETPAGQELYFHSDNLAGHDFDKLAEGSEVQFLEDIGGEGFQAKRVSTGKHHGGEGEEG